ncbi:hypothetical protein [Embleya scabrispora]|uniref:hypothetical protein n=1 Tax=Embleya scabrispora TaxID=159449 RepID=UPI0003A8806D|nr:hypothetical protein [Embleya scabrispora]MYS85312.1 hypothetical protein [Streptomyces sp. SID5474]
MRSTTRRIALAVGSTVMALTAGLTFAGSAQAGGNMNYYAQTLGDDNRGLDGYARFFSNGDRFELTDEWGGSGSAIVIEANYGNGYVDFAGRFTRASVTGNTRVLNDWDFAEGRQLRFKVCVAEDQWTEPHGCGSWTYATA